MKGLELNEITVIDLLELVLMISAEDMNYRGEWASSQGVAVGGRVRRCLQICEAEILTF